jgi:ectoine hydroxylase-related dioxygenase (phytanoyl-CoA dioxygenase family)
MLDTLQLDDWNNNGYVNAGPLFDSSELAQITEEYDRLVTFEGQVLGNPKDGVYPYRAMMNFRSPTLAGVILHPALLEIAVQLLGEDVRFWWDQGINKAAGAGSVIAWHQDNGYQHGRMQPYLTCWLTLDDSSLENGGLEVIPGSHTNGLCKHEMRGVHAVIDESLIATDAAVPLDAKAGDMLFFSSLLVHQTVGNLTNDQQRRAWVIQYCRGDQHNEVTGEVYDNRPWVVRRGVSQQELRSERPFNLKADRSTGPKASA